MLKHIFLMLFFLAFTFSIILSGLLYYLYHSTVVTHYRRLAWVFLFAGLFMFFWYLSSYLALNILHRETALYSTLEAAAFICIGASVLLLLDSLRQISNPERQGKALLFIAVVLATAVLVFSKFAFYILGYHYWLFYYAKRAIALGFVLGTMTFSARILLRANMASITFPAAVRLTLGSAGILLPLLSALDFLVVKDKFYEGAVSLSMNYPLFLSGYILFCLILISLLISRIALLQNPGRLLRSFTSVYQVTPREMEVLELLLKGKSNQDIADNLYISLATVKNHVNHIFNKLGVSSRAELIRIVLTSKQPE